MEGRRVVRELKDAGVYDLIVDYILAAIHWAFVLAAASAIGMVAESSAICSYEPEALLTDKACALRLAGVTFWVFALASVGAASYRVVRIFAVVLRAPEGEEQQRQQ